MQPKRILMPTDFSNCAEAALNHAIYLAQQFQAELHLLHAVVLHGESPRDLRMAFPDIDVIYTRLQEIASTEMGRMLSQRQTGTLKLREVQTRGIAVAPAIVEYAEAEEIDLIVLGTHGRRGLRRFLLGSVAEEVVRTAGCPVVTVPHEDARHTDSIERIVVPFDFSADSVWALETAKELAATYGSRLDVVHAIMPPMAAGGVADSPLPSGVWVDIEKKIREDLVQRVESTAGPEVPIETHVLEGRAAGRITKFAEEMGADLIVIGSHGLSGLRRFLLGSVSERVVRSAHCPVLVTRQPDTVGDSGEAENGQARLAS